jgi:quercetin dioxygenase-like cupin family protein
MGKQSESGGATYHSQSRHTKERNSNMPVKTTGRMLDGNGQPIDGTGFEYDSDGRLAGLLDQRRSVIFSQPQTGEWVFGLALSNETGGEFERGVGVFKPGNSGPAEHIHPNYDEHFEVVQGDFIFKIGGIEQAAHPGEKLVAQKGTPHTFRCVGDVNGAVVAETRPAARTGYVISTLFGMAHEGKLTQRGQPKLLHAMVIGSEYADDTVFTSPPPAIAVPMAKAIAPIARLLGYRATYAEYQEEAFWHARVEQPVRPVS